MKYLFNRIQQFITMLFDSCYIFIFHASFNQICEHAIRLFITGKCYNMAFYGIKKNRLNWLNRKNWRKGIIEPSVGREKISQKGEDIGHYRITSYPERKGQQIGPKTSMYIYTFTCLYRAEYFGWTANQGTLFRMNREEEY